MNESKPEGAYNNACGHAYNDSDTPYPVCSTSDYLRGEPDKIRAAQAKRIAELEGEVVMLRTKVAAGERLAETVDTLAHPDGIVRGPIVEGPELDLLNKALAAFRALPTPGEGGSK